MIWQIVHVATGRHFTLFTEELVIGRDEICRVRYLDIAISRKHCSIRRTVDNDRVLVEDLNSSNGTFIKNDRLHSKIPYLLLDKSIFSLSRPCEDPDSGNADAYYCFQLVSVATPSPCTFADTTLPLKDADCVSLSSDDENLQDDKIDTEIKQREVENLRLNNENYENCVQPFKLKTRETTKPRWKIYIPDDVNLETKTKSKTTKSTQNKKSKPPKKPKSVSTKKDLNEEQKSLRREKLKQLAEKENQQRRVTFVNVPEKVKNSPIFAKLSKSNRGSFLTDISPNIMQ